MYATLSWQSKIFFFFLAVIQISAGFQQVKLGERGGRRRDFHDAGINTRQAMEHVKESKSGWSWFEIDTYSAYIPFLYNLCRE